MALQGAFVSSIATLFSGKWTREYNIFIFVWSIKNLFSSTLYSQKYYLYMICSFFVPLLKGGNKLTQQQPPTVDGNHQPWRRDRTHAPSWQRLSSFWWKGRFFFVQAFFFIRPTIFLTALLPCPTQVMTPLPCHHEPARGFFTSHGGMDFLLGFRHAGRYGHEIKGFHSWIMLCVFCKKKNKKIGRFKAWKKMCLN